MKILALTILPLSLFCAAPAFAASDNLPNFNVEPSCRAAALASNAQDRLQGCLDSEKHAREQLAQEWTKFAPPVRELCLRSASVGGEPTYTELITCLEMDRDSKLKQVSQRVPDVPAASPTGVGPKTAIERAKGH